MNKRDDYLAFAYSHPALFANPPGAGYEILLDQASIEKTETRQAVALKHAGLPIEWAQVGIVYQDQYIRILRDAVRFPNGELGTYIRNVGYGIPGVIILPVYQGQVLLIRHFRHATRTWHLEIPRGFGEPGLSEEENARRELVEEIGASSSRLISLGLVYPDTGGTSAYNSFFYAEVEVYGQVDTNEAIEMLMPIPIETFEQMVSEKNIDDGFTLTAYALAKAQGLL